MYILKIFKLKSSCRINQHWNKSLITTGQSMGPTDQCEKCNKCNTCITATSGDI